MGHLELFAQRTFAEETARITRGAVGWQDPPEIRLEKVTSDGFLVIRQPHLLAPLAAPWPEVRPHGEVMLELKLAGNHLDRKAIERALLRRQARQVQRVEEQDASWLGEEPLWLVAPHLPDWLVAMRTPVCFAPGCYWVEPQWSRFLWIAANELPLVDELVPFLMARSGPALDEFGRWVAPRRPVDWVLAMLVIRPIRPRSQADGFESLNFRTSRCSRSMRLSRARKGGRDGRWLRSQRERWSRSSSGSGAKACASALPPPARRSGPGSTRPPWRRQTAQRGASRSATARGSRGT